MAISIDLCNCFDWCLVANGNIEKEGKEFVIGGTEDECGFIVITIDSVTLKGLYDRVAVCLSGVEDSIVNGSVIAATYDPRYSE